MNWSAFVGAWLGTWFWIVAVGVIWIAVDRVRLWLREHVFSPWRKVDRMRRGKQFTEEQWDIFVAELRRVSDAQQRQIRAVEVNRENEAKVEKMAEMIEELVKEIGRGCVHKPHTDCATCGDPSKPRSCVAYRALRLLADVSEQSVEGRSYAAYGNTPAKALFRLKEAIQEKEGWSW